MSDGAKPFGKPFRKGEGGRMRGARNKLSAAFVDALRTAFEERGEEAIRIVIDERPHEFLRIIAAIIPKEFEISDSRLKDLSDEQLDELIDVTRRYLGRVGESD